MTDKEEVLYSLDLGETTGFGIVRKRFPEVEKAQVDRTDALKKFMEDRLAPEDLLDVEEEVDGKVISVKYLTGKANDNLRTAVIEKYKDVKLETVQISGQLIDKFIMKYKTIRPGISSIVRGIVVSLIIIVMACWGLVVTNPDRYRVW